MPGMGHSDAWWKMYEALRREGKTKEQAARITNAKKKRKGKK
jgi:hypothetical protein